MKTNTRHTRGIKEMRIATGFDFEPLADGNVLIEFFGDDGKTSNKQIVTAEVVRSIPLVAILTDIALKQGPVAKEIMEKLKGQTVKTYLYQVLDPNDSKLLVDFGALRAADFNAAFEMLLRRLVKLGHCGRTLPGRLYPVAEVPKGRFQDAGDCITIEINVPDDEDWEGDGDEYPS